MMHICNWAFGVACVCQSPLGHEEDHLCGCGNTHKNRPANSRLTESRLAETVARFTAASEMIADIMMILRQNLTNVPKEMSVRELAQWCLTEQQRKAIKEYEQFRDKESRILEDVKAALDDIDYLLKGLPSR